MRSLFRRRSMTTDAPSAPAPGTSPKKSSLFPFKKHTKKTGTSPAEGGASGHRRTTSDSMFFLEDEGPEPALSVSISEGVPTVATVLDTPIVKSFSDHDSTRIAYVYIPRFFDIA
jgi:hypothetical protein